MERVREQQQQQHQQQQQQLRRVLRRSEVTARRDNARRADVDRSALQYALASSLRQLLPEQRLECLELAQVMAASKREDEEQRAGVAVAEARDETQAIVTSNIYQHETTMTYGPSFARTRRPPRGDDVRCLLYTSPSPRDLARSRMPSSA